MSETQFNRIATLEKKKVFLNKELKLDDYKEDDEDGSNKSPLNSPQSNKEEKRGRNRENKRREERSAEREERSV